MKHVTINIFLIICFLALLSCTPPGSGVKPKLSSINPGSKVSHMPDFLLTVKGTGFDLNSRIVFGGIEKDTTFVSPTELSCHISTENITIQPEYNNDTYIPVYVTNYSLFIADSNSEDFIVRQYHIFHSAKKICDSSSSNSAINSPAICMDKKGNMYIVMTNDYEKENVYFSVSADMGETWKEPVNLSNNDFHNYRPKIAVFADKIYVLWCYAGKNVLVQSSDQGITWSRECIISDEFENSAHPAIDVDSSGNINIIYLNSIIDGIYGDHNVFFKRSTDSGQTWSEPVKIKHHSSFGSSYTCIASANENNIYIIWPSDYCITHSTSFFSHSSDFGTTWIESINLGSNVYAFALDRMGNLNIVGGSENYIPYAYTLEYARSTDQGRTWTNRSKLSESHDWEIPDIGLDNASNNNDVWGNHFIRSVDNGENWGQITDYTNSTKAIYPSLVLDQAGNIYIVWKHKDGGIYFTESIQ